MLMAWEVITKDVRFLTGLLNIHPQTVFYASRDP